MTKTMDVIYTDSSLIRRELTIKYGDILIERSNKGSIKITLQSHHQPITCKITNMNDIKYILNHSRSIWSDQYIKNQLRVIVDNTVSLECWCDKFSLTDESGQIITCLCCGYWLMEPLTLRYICGKYILANKDRIIINGKIPLACYNYILKLGYKRTLTTI